MIHFKPAPHTAKSGDVIEIWNGDDFVGAIYPTPSGIKVISKHPKTVIQNNNYEVLIDIRHRQDPDKQWMGQMPHSPELNAPGGIGCSCLKCVMWRRANAEST